MNKKEVYIGVDLGGTKIMVGAISKEGNIIGSPFKVPTGSRDPKENILHRIFNSIEKTIDQLNIKDKRKDLHIGVGTTGPLDIEKGMILECPQLPTMQFFSLQDAIQDHFGVQVAINNDANCLIFGESRFGAAKEKESVVGFTLGTGIGCGIILNGKIWNGATGTSGEVWISPYKDGVIEDYISGAGISRLFERMTGKYKSSLDIFHLAENGEREALLIWEEFGSNLAVPVAWGINFLDPEIVLLGGSISKAYKFFKDSLEVNLRKRICPSPSKNIKVVVSKLGENAGFIGAACLAISAS